MSKLTAEHVETHSVLGDVQEWKYKGSEENIWRGGDASDSGNFWSFVITLENQQANLDGWFYPDQLRAIADYMDRFKK
jgi:hypothetical protein